MEKSKFTFSSAPAFLRDYKKLTEDLQDKVDETLKEIRNDLQTGVASYGLRIKPLSQKIYEGRVDIHTRIVYFRDKNLVQFIAVGNHNHVNRTLKSISH